MSELLFRKIQSTVPVTESTFSEIRNLFVSKKLRKRHYILQQGDVAKYQVFVEKGVLRSYTTDEKGVEQVLQFATEGWWIADLASFLTAQPSHLNIDAIEDAELLLITKDAWEQAMETTPALERYFRLIMQNHLVATQKRLLQSLHETAEQRYSAFIQTYPDCLRRVPQHMIASYLGITRETLSRLRRKMSGPDMRMGDD